MKLLLIPFAFLALLNSVAEGKCKPDEMCPIPYTKTMQKQMLAYHNNARSKANPTAADMQTMYWDSTMAEMALEHSKKCKFEHNKGFQRRFDGYVSVGQNLWSGTRKPNASAPAIGWYAEVRYFTFGQETDKVVGHYTQVMQGKSARIGCGGAYCPNRKLKYIVTCHYLKGQYDYTDPYTLGKPCAACPDKCKKNMCDCGGRVCKNGATLNLATCQCECLGLTSGDECEKFDCHTPEWEFCRFYKKYCSVRYGFKPRTRCPHTCDMCKKK